ncbi:MAG TPA: hypothetical protein VKB50_06190 [Vicinamibacterales bacterium]|nr:hypothetical protein [Vicinamibacterales bacterium]
MALGGNATFTNTIDQGRRIFNIANGGKIIVTDLGLVTAASVIVTGAITLDSTDFRRMGLSKMLGILHASGWTSAPAFVPLTALWDGKTNKIMLYDLLGAALTAAAIGNGGTIRMSVLGM